MATKDISDLRREAEVRTAYRASIESQLRDWVAGIDRHTRDLPSGIDEECTPDMACCFPCGAWSHEVRLQFATASDEDRYTMSFHALCNMLDMVFGIGAVVHIAGLASPQKH